MEALRKITIKNVGDYTQKKIKESISEAKLEENATLPLMKIAGEVVGAATGQTTHGTFTRLMGQFIATDLLTGALYSSGQCILPEFVGGPMGVALAGGAQVQFAVEIGVKRKDSAITGYEFVVRPLIHAEPSAKMAELARLAGIGASPALATPAEPPAAPTPAAPDAPASKRK